MSAVSFLPVMVAGAFLASCGPASVVAVIGLPVVGGQAIYQHARIARLASRLRHMERPAQDYLDEKSEFSAKDLTWLKLERERIEALDDLADRRTWAARLGWAVVPLIGILAASMVEDFSAENICDDCGDHRAFLHKLRLDQVISTLEHGEAT